MDESNQKAHMNYMWACKELRRMVSSGAYDGLKDPQISERVKRGSFSVWRDAMAGWGQHWTVSLAVSEYTHKLHSHVREYRKNAAHVTPYNPVAQRTQETCYKAHSILVAISNRNSLVPLVVCGTEAGKAVVNSRLHLRIPVTWKSKVYDKGIFESEAFGKRCLTVKATPKSSAFLAEDGITVFDAVVFVPTKEGEVLEGFIFKAEGGFCLFHTDFRLGANLIRKRVRNAVLEILMAGG